jgi:hypothetical protein
VHDKKPRMLANECLSIVGYYLTVSKNRFQFLLRCLQFGDILDRHACRKLNLLAPVREVCMLMVNNFEK